MSTEKRLEELRNAKAKLEVLVKALVVVNMDSTARGILEEVLDSAGLNPSAVQDLVIIAMAHANARVEVESRAARERAA